MRIRHNNQNRGSMKEERLRSRFSQARRGGRAIGHVSPEFHIHTDQVDASEPGLDVRRFLPPSPFPGRNTGWGHSFRIGFLDPGTM